MTFDISNCEFCPLKGKRPVAGRGDPRARIWFVGEAPGKDEEKKGSAFVGSSGKILDRAIAQLGLEEGSYYITNIVRCRPEDDRGNNRKPNEDEQSSCVDHLIEEMTDYTPKIVITLGVVAKNNLPGNKTSKKYGPLELYHGDLEGGEFDIVHILHPAATLYDPYRAREWDLQVEALKRIIVDVVLTRLFGGGGYADG